MRIILNSDVLHVKRLRKIGLAGHIDRFCREDAASGAILVLPRTVLLENERNQRQLYDKSLAELQATASVLRFWGIAVPEHDAQDYDEDDRLFEPLASP